MSLKACLSRIWRKLAFEGTRPAPIICSSSTTKIFFFCGTWFFFQNRDRVIHSFHRVVENSETYFFVTGHKVGHLVSVNTGKKAHNSGNLMVSII